jgi:phage terminase large subunit-like protein
MVKVDAGEGYVEEVLAGRRAVGRWARLAVERHARDLEEGEGRGLWFDRRAAQMGGVFFERALKHSKGEWAGRPVVLEGWQRFLVGQLLGWKREDGSRRFRTGYVEVPRKNGKTLLAAGLGLFLMAADGEAGAEVYSAATTREQARLSHGEAVRMVKQSQLLRRELRLFRDNIHSEASFSKFEPLSSDHGTLDGLNVHGAICDELHAWPRRELWDVLETATSARRQPLMVAITTAGYDRQSLCWQMHEYAGKVLDQLVEDDSFFGMIYGIDEGDDWEDEANWWKANPNLGVSKSIDDLRRLAGRAREMPAQLNAFLRLHLDVWTQSETRWMRPEAWGACDLGAVDEAALAGRVCYGGLDLSTTTDIAALVWVFPPEREGEVFVILPRFWVPEENIVLRSRNDRVPYEAWERAGLITPTPGNVVDYAFILAQMAEDVGRFSVQEIAFDRWGATKLVTEMVDRGWTVVEFGQGFASMSAPMKELEKLVLSRQLSHGGNRVLAWMADNVVASMDPAGNIKPDKARSREKIDGIVAGIMALDRALRKRVRRSVYEERGVVVLEDDE